MNILFKFFPVELYTLFIFGNVKGSRAINSGPLLELPIFYEVAYLIQIGFHGWRILSVVPKTPKTVKILSLGMC